MLDKQDIASMNRMGRLHFFCIVEYCPNEFIRKVGGFQFAPD
ncbi:hypothetical protein SAMN05414137_104176 [Streptacidiphilus jiangxiensis]|uniref:Uncharacterized protein n=1 Tax=Streptacidiphilus jiangxiensis TaxID=235985 RepID=A0A1H7KUE1_STRJI|nr:hypothetical protein SAMN05414137_104176 [Streptacidiphilus jiangxiensis]